jgi:DNA-binding CsgD family transcriptional regulator
VIVLGRDSRIELATELAARWLTEQSGSAGRLRLPEPLDAWSAAERRAAHDGRAGGVRLELHLADGPLTAQFVPRGLGGLGGLGGLDAIILRPRAPLRADVLHDRGLTDREIQVVILLAGGLSNAQMAGELGVSERTIAKHLEHVYNKLDVANRTAAVARARGIDAPSATGGSHAQDGLGRGQRP